MSILRFVVKNELCLGHFPGCGRHKLDHVERVDRDWVIDYAVTLQRGRLDLTDHNRFDKDDVGGSTG